MDISAIDQLFKDSSTVMVTFVKKNGERREMLCTTKLDLVPAVSHPKGERVPNPETKPVWDLQKQAWRSFRYDSVIDAKAVSP
jgi:hypothetical protein